MNFYNHALSNLAMTQEELEKDKWQNKQLHLRIGC